MPFFLTGIGLVLVITGIRDTYSQLGAQLRSDFTGEKSFVNYALAIGLVGSMGYVDRLRAASNLFMALIIVSLVLANKGFFDKFGAAIKAGPQATQGSTPASASAPATATQGNASGIPLVAPFAGAISDPFAAPNMTIVPGSLADTFRKFF